MAVPAFDALLEQPVFRTYFFYVGLLSLKLLGMSLLTGAKRFITKAYVNPEDAAGFKVKVKTHEDVERVRRAHLNDLENIPVFFAVCFAYLTTNPSVFLASTLIRVFTLCRFIHTIVYAVVVIPQPARGLSWGIAFFITVYMGISTILHYL
ncbi:unnamed protein product [Ceutorhynchus assimilis]|uniref:Microsomal glutathione S-transferase 1 n=1 Tax=Ceutorhynchus assimilis TaxID=467358 RepID=A0A9N9MQE7_9CUCU|nr:unnamed protein product [Ceutorhynchus assimilis]